MKTKLIILLMILFVLSAAYSQDLFDFNETRKSLNIRGMYLLFAWAIGNIIAGGIGFFKTRGELKSFHGMNVGWNLINLIIAGFSLYAALGIDPSSLGLSASITGHYNGIKAFTFNAGLDIGYIGLGLFLRELANRKKNPERFKGVGSSIIMQGAFLFLFDLGMFFIHEKNGELLFASVF